MWEWKNLRMWIGTSEASLTNRRQKMEDRLSGIKDKIKEIDTLL